MGAQKAPLQKSYEMSVGSIAKRLSFLVQRDNLIGSKFLWFTTKVTDTTIYDSYDVELAAKYIKSIKLENFIEIYSLTNEKKIFG